MQVLQYAPQHPISLAVMEPQSQTILWVLLIFHTPPGLHEILGFMVGKNMLDQPGRNHGLFLMVRECV
jgi:hypothetical protein